MNLPSKLWAALLLAQALSPLRASAGLAITTDGQPTATIVLAESIRPNDLAVAPWSPT